MTTTLLQQVVEDHPVNKTVAFAILKRLGVKSTVWARDGLEGVDAMQMRSDPIASNEPPFQIILMDMQAGRPPSCACQRSRSACLGCMLVVPLLARALPHPRVRLAPSARVVWAGTAVDDSALSSSSARTEPVAPAPCQMPRCDGLEATRRIRALEAAAGKPRAEAAWIIGLTANASEEDRADCMQGGMDAFLCVRSPLMLPTTPRLLTAAQPEGSIDDAAREQKKSRR